MKDAIPILLAMLIAAPAHAQETTQDATVSCPLDAAQRCLQVPGVAIPPEAGGTKPLILSALGPWSASVSGGVAPRDGGPTGSYGAMEVRRQIGHGYLQVGAMRYHAPLLTNAVSVASDFTIGTVAGGTRIGNWIVDGYVSYGWQDFGAVRVENTAGTALIQRAANGREGSPYYGAGVSLGYILPVGDRWFLTPTTSVVYAWGRWLHPLGDGTPPQDFTTGETTWTGTARLRMDRMMGRRRRSYLGVSVAGVWSSNASSFAGAGGAIAGGSGGVVGPGLPDPGGSIFRLRDPWVEVAGHGSMALSRSLRAEVSVARTAGLVTGNTTTINMGLRRQF
jgi:hypothetical protein